MSEPREGAGLVTGLQVIAIFVTDLEASKRFYVELLGFEEAGAMEPGLLLRAGDLTVYLEGGRAEGAGPPLSRATVSPCFGAESIRAAHEQLLAAGATIVVPHRELAPGFSMFSVADPDGNVLEFAGEP